MTPEEASELAAEGTVAEILAGHLTEMAALSKKSGWTDRVTSIELERLASRPMIAIAGGPGKGHGVLAALKGRWMAGPVTDLNTAQELLQH
jgi:DNA-binding transcriptional regulator LsrR (DeoR family)